VDVDAKGFQKVLAAAAAHKGTAYIEIFQNCNIFNDGAFIQLTDKKSRPQHALYLEHGKAMTFGAANEKGIMLDSQGKPQVVDVASVDADQLLVHDETSDTIPFLLSRMNAPEFPTPLGVLRKVDRPSYDSLMNAQIEEASAKRVSVQDLLNAGETWTVD
jgi:2-oxoglutarate ferredoxin oxidoreductase subunit beta